MAPPVLAGGGLFGDLREREGAAATGAAAVSEEAPAAAALGGKRLGVERWVTLSGDQDRDLALLRSYYADKAALYPEKAGDIRFRSPAG